jgi:hypothetical protein
MGRALHWVAGQLNFGCMLKHSFGCLLAAIANVALGQAFDGVQPGMA